MSQTTSTTFISDLKAGNSEAWRQYVETYTPLIANWLRKQGMCDPQERLDFIQDTNARVWKHIETFRKPQRCGTFRGWLKTIALNQLRSHYRSLSHRPLHLPIVADCVIDTRPTLTDDAESVRILVRQVVMTMKQPQLNLAQKNAVLEHLLQGTSVLQAAKKFEVSEGTLRVKINACLAKLRRLLQDER